MRFFNVSKFISQSLSVIESQQIKEEQKDPRKKLLRLMMKAKAKHDKEQVEKVINESI